MGVDRKIKETGQGKGNEGKGLERKGRKGKGREGEEKERKGKGEEYIYHRAEDSPKKFFNNGSV